MKTCLIIGEISTIEVLSGYIKSQSITIKAAVTSCEEGLELIKFHKPNIVYIDVEFVADYCFELNLLKQFSLFVIISNKVLNYDDFECLAFDCMPKPIEFNRFKKGMEKYGAVLFHSRNQQPMVPAESDPLFIDIVDRTLKTTRFKHQDLLFIESMENYMHIHTVKGDCYVLRTPLKSLAALLPLDTFSRVHRSFIVRDEQIDSISRIQLFMKGRPKFSIPIGNAYKDDFLAKAHIQLIKIRKKEST